MPHCITEGLITNGKNGARYVHGAAEQQRQGIAVSNSLKEAICGVNLTPCCCDSLGFPKDVAQVPGATLCSLAPPLIRLLAWFGRRAIDPTRTSSC